MTELAILYVLAVLDGFFVGYRDAAGRNPLLDKRRYYVRAALLGVGLVHLAVLVIVATVGVTLWFAPEAVAGVDSLERLAAILRVVYLGYTVVVLVTFAVYALPSYDLQSYISVAIFGLLTLLRPVVIIGGVIAAAIQVGDPVVWPVSAAIIVTMGGLQPIVYWLGWNDVDPSKYVE